MEALTYLPKYGWAAREDIHRALTVAEIAELKHRNAMHITPVDLPGTPEFSAMQKWLAEKPEREAMEKAKRDGAAKAAALARVAQHEAIIKAVSNDYPCISQARRTAINQAVLKNYTSSYIFSGDGGVGKTHLLRAVAKMNATDGKRVLWTTGMEWEADIRRNACADFEDKRNLAISTQGLENCRPVLICFDEVDRMKRSDFVLNEFCSLLNTCIAGHHRFVATTNLSQADFKELMGASITWRLLQASEPNGKGGLGCSWVNFNG